MSDSNIICYTHENKYCRQIYAYFDLVLINILYSSLLFIYKHVETYNYDLYCDIEQF